MTINLLDPDFRAWCVEQDLRAVELDLPLPHRSELAERYQRVSREVHGLSRSAADRTLNPYQRQIPMLSLVSDARAQPPDFQSQFAARSHHRLRVVRE